MGLTRCLVTMTAQAMKEHRERETERASERCMKGILRPSMSLTGVHRRSFINAVIDSCLIPHNNLWLHRSEALPRGRKCATGFHPNMRILMVFIYLFIFAPINTLEGINIIAV